MKSGKYDGLEFTCTNGKTYKCVSYKGKSTLYMILNDKNVQVDVLIESILKEVLEGKRPLIYTLRNEIRTMVIQEDEGDDFDVRR